MKATKFFAAGVALLGVLACTDPAQAKLEDTSVNKTEVTGFRSGLKTKAGKTAVQRRPVRQRTVRGERPVQSKNDFRRQVETKALPKKPAILRARVVQEPGRLAAGKDITLERGPTNTITAQTSTGRNPNRLAVRRLVNVETPAVARSSAPVTAIAERARTVREFKRVVVKRPIEAEPPPPKRISLPVMTSLEPVRVAKEPERGPVKKQVTFEPAPQKDIPKIAKFSPANNDGLPPFARANRKSRDRDAKTEVAAMIASMAPCQNVPAWFALRVAMTESSLVPSARGSDGEIGLFQLKCSTARYLGFKGRCQALYDARTNAYWGLKHLSKALSFSDGDLRYAASKHNGGLATTSLRSEYIRRVLCSSEKSGFPTAFQLGAEAEVLQICGKAHVASDVVFGGTWTILDAVDQPASEFKRSFVEVVSDKHMASTASCVPPNLGFPSYKIVTSDADSQHRKAKQALGTEIVNALGTALHSQFKR